jgi:hypothetical protein
MLEVDKLSQVATEKIIGFDVATHMKRALEVV